MLPEDRVTVVIERFIAACQADQRVIAAFLGGSYARGVADEHSDLDFGLIATDQAYEEFAVGLEDFVRQLGEPLFLESFDLPDNVFCIFADGTEAEFMLGSESRFAHIHNGPYRTLVDKVGLLTGAVFPPDQAVPAEQVERLRRLIYWFWHDLSHFITAMGRRQLWWAYGQLEMLRRYCVSLARLRYDFQASFDLDEPCYKIERAVPIEQLAPIQDTFCPMEFDAILQAGQKIVNYYQELATDLAQRQGVTYPVGLQRIMFDRLVELSKR